MAEGEIKADLDNQVVEVETFCPVNKSEEVPNPMVATQSGRMGRMGGFLPMESCVPPGTFTLRDRQYMSEADLLTAQRYKKAGPKTCLYYDPNNVNAAIITCGDLCPGKHFVVRELVMMLWYGYGVRNIVGVKYGYEGFYKLTHEGEDCYVTLMPDFPAHLTEVPKKILAVKDIHTLGGTILGSSCGGFEGRRMVDSLEQRDINQVYAIGGDGTHHGLLALSKIIKERRIKITLIGVPKTIDNDMLLIDKTFGFDSAVEVAMWAIQCADVEANCAEYGVGLVKVMGRYAGHIAMHASLANRDVNVCLIPEFPFDIYGPKGVLECIMKRLRERHHCVIVVSEGAASEMQDVKLPSKSQKDPSGKIIPTDIGSFLKEEIPKYGRIKHSMDVTLKYIDSSYILCSIPANSSDKYLCAVLAQYAVHAAMAGYTNYTVGILRTYSALIPFSHIAPRGQTLVKFNDRNWQRLIQSTGQPPFLNDSSDISH